MRKFLFRAILLVLGPFMYFNDGQIVADLNMRDEPLDVANIGTSNRKCTSYIFVFQECGFSYRLGNGYIHQSYFFLSNGAPKTIQLLRGRFSGELTSTVGQDYIWNRFFSIALFVFAGLLVLWSLFEQYFTSQNNRTSSKPGT